ncbi:MAG: PH domain-containing protein [Actinomycetota bacterium]|nr:PH domain-containing protein [Actinomycetota bacterium]
MGEERWRRSLRNVNGAAVGFLAPFFLIWAFGSALPLPLRIAAGVCALLSVATAIDAWRAEVVVGSEGVLVRRALQRRRLAWSDLEGFTGERRGYRGDRILVRAVRRHGRPTPITDQPLAEAQGEELLQDLGKELESHRTDPA